MSKRHEIAYLTHVSEEYARNWQRARNEADALKRKVTDLEYEVESRERSLARVTEDRATANHRRQAAEQENAELRDRLAGVEQALRVLAAPLHGRYTPRIGLSAGEMDWDAMIADAKRVEEYNATTEVLHFIEIIEGEEKNDD